MRKRERSLLRMPDAVVSLRGHIIDIEVELTRKPQREIERTLRGNWGASHLSHALRYYVSHQAQATVHAAWKTSSVPIPFKDAAPRLGLFPSMTCSSALSTRRNNQRF